jgi:hypothetical protein
MKRYTIFCILGALIAAQVACGLPGLLQETATVAPTLTAAQADPATPEPTQTVQPPTAQPKPTLPAETPSNASPFSLEQLKNFSYWLEEFNAQVTLVNGTFDDGNLNTRLVEPPAFGDLNGDGQEDAAVILATNSGGSGTFYDLITLFGVDGAPVQAGSSYLGDRQVVKDLAITGGRVVLDYLTQGLSDPLCCASEHRLRSYLIEGSALRLASEQVLDSPDAQATPLPDEILIDQPEEGNFLTYPQLVQGRVSQSPPERKLSYYVTDLNATLLMDGEVDVSGEPGGPGVFTVEIVLEALPPGLVQVEVVDSANGNLRGRSVVVLVVQ